MSEITYRIWFEPKHPEIRRARYVPDPNKPNGREVPLEVHERATAERIIEVYNRPGADNPCWRGTFSIVEHLNGRPL